MPRSRRVDPPRTPGERSMWALVRTMRAAQRQYYDWRGDAETRRRLLSRALALEAIVDEVLLHEPPDLEALDRAAAEIRRLGDAWWEGKR